MMPLLPHTKAPGSVPAPLAGALVLCLALVPFVGSPGSAGEALREGSPEAPASGADLQAGLDEARRWIDEGRYAEAEVRARRLLEQAEAASGPEALETAGVLDLLVESLWRGGKSKEPETRRLAERAIALKQSRAGPDDIRVADSLNNLGIVCSDGGDHAAAQSAYERALAIREKALGPEHPDVARTLNNLGVLAFRRGEFAAARALHERALSIREKVLGAEDALVAQSLANLATVSEEAGDYAAARPLYERALAIRRKALGPEHPYVAWSLSDLARILAAMGDESTALPLCEQALAVAEKKFGPRHPAVARILGGFGALLAGRGDHARAQTIFERALAIRRETHIAEHADVAGGLTDLADALAAAGDVGRAGPLYEQALPIWEKAAGPEHPSLARALHGLGGVMRRTGDAARAEALHLRALAIREKALGAEHPAVASSLAALAELRLEAGRLEEALGDALRAEAITRQHVRLTLRSLPERLGLRFSEAAARGHETALSVASRVATPEAGRAVWDALIHSRALVLDEMAARQRAAWRAPDGGVEDLARQVASSRTRLANLIVRGPGETDPARHRRLLEEAARETEEAERALADRSLSFRQDLERWSVGLDEVSAALPEGASLVAFVRHRHLAPGAPASPHYLAFVLAGRDAPPRAVPLGPARPIEEQVGIWRGEIAAAARGGLGRGSRLVEQRYRQAADRLRRLVWDPVEPHLRSSRLVLLVPDGALSLVSWATLPSGGDTYLIETAPDLHYLSTERDVVLPGGAPGAAPALLALGGPDFERGRGDARQGEAAPAALPRASPPGARGALPACGDFRSLRFAPLPGARDEAGRVASLWRSGGAPAPRGAATMLVGPDATEARFKQEAPRHAILHVATHGFFLGGGCPAAGDLTEAAGSPLLLSGLALAGANRRGEAPAPAGGGEDGVLTAEEIAALDLSGVDWVVLSACGSALGQPRAGEGVIGLRRAFKVAGGRSLISSLWEVDDAVAQRWIDALYRARLEGAATAQAARRASLDLLRARREAGLSTHPYFWGGFIAEGDWR